MAIIKKPHCHTIPVRLSFLIAIAVIVFTITTTQAEAAPSYKGKVLGIVISKSCQLSPSCVQYNDILSYDNSNPGYSGGFGPDPKTGDIKRMTPKYKNELGFYYTDKTFRVMIDPPATIKGQIQLITILPQLQEFHDTSQKKIAEYRINNDTKPTEKIREWSTQRSVNDNCMAAMISGRNWQTLLPDTIEYMRHDCDPDHTKVSTIQTELIPLTKQDISTSYKSKDQKWRDYIIHNCTKSRNACTELSQPTRGGL